ncbi:receptor-like protein kinase [Trifolium pratense]|uniref:Receptor-like protein kinase n=1 Tax=Trifolium pratense TaxID=57577 RepID=A0A2K3PEN8_TRIPR|nr:receptor-like protein kinase [Trifolium pratense]
MPRCRWGFVHVLNNDYTHWIMYAIGGSSGPTILSQGNRFIAPDNNAAKFVTHRDYASQDVWSKWQWTSQDDFFMNGAQFVQSGSPIKNLPFKKGYLMKPRHGREANRLTRVFDLPNLKVLDLRYNPNLKGRLPEFHSSSLTKLALDQTGFYGTLPISLKDNKFRGDPSASLANLTKLSILNVGFNDFTADTISWIGEIFPSICNLKSLVHLELSYNNLSGNVLSCLGNSSRSLEVLMLKGNKLSGLIPQTYQMENNLQMIDLSNNNLHGPLPRTLVNNRRLKYFEEMIQSWKAMKTSNTSQLQYEQEVVYLSLIAIDISSNKISGEIPQVIGDLKDLVFLNLSNNILTGHIPSSLGKLSNLEASDLSLNSFSGNLPQQLTQLTFLEFFNVSFNNLSGPIPQHKQFATFQGNSFEGNQGLCGDQLLKKCTIDHSEPSPFTPSTFERVHESESFFEFGWKIVLIGFIVGLVAGVALGSTFSLQVLEWLERVL